TYDALFDRIVESIRTALGAILILLLIGALAGTWLISGIVPAMIVHGLQLISPQIFLVAACLVSAVVSIATGSSWSTAATVGIALMGIGKALGFSPGLVAGAIISGAYFGDKLSPLSDTTNLAAAVAGTDLFTHIRYLMLTTVPSILIALVIFLLIGIGGDDAVALEGVQSFAPAIQSAFNIGWWLYLVPAAVIVMIWRKVPALPALFVGTLLGAVFAIIFQPATIEAIAGGSSPRHAYMAVLQAMGGSVSIETG